MTQLPPDDTTKSILRDRRSGRRIVTKRNALRITIALVVVFIGISIASEFHDEAPGEYGRLYERRTKRADVAPRKPYTVVQENPISDQVGSDPMLLEAARRQQYLGVSDADLQRMREEAMGLNTSTQGAITIPPGNQGVLETNSDREKPRLEISGGPGGVTVEQKPPERP